MNIIEQIFPDEEFVSRNGILFHKSSIKKENFSNLYFQLRTNEKRIYSDDFIKDLSFFEKKNNLSREWRIKQASIRSLLSEINNQSEIHNILDLGCGNGWLSNFLSNQFNSTVIGIDVNQYELKQAKRVFEKNKRLIFINGDIDEIKLAPKSIDIIILSSSIQYFPNFGNLLVKLIDSLTEIGIIFIFGSILYTNKTVNRAKINTKSYYNNIGFSELSDFYHHHQLENLKDFTYEIIFDPSKLYRKILRKLFPESISPFHFIKITK
jgi:ubiquinone/menaquinone biosynthesis C-methylase UbiE